MKFALTFRQKGKEKGVSAYVSKSKREVAFIMISRQDERDVLYFCAVLEILFFQLYKT